MRMHKCLYGTRSNIPAEIGGLPFWSYVRAHRHWWWWWISSIGFVCCFGAFHLDILLLMIVLSLFRWCITNLYVVSECVFDLFLHWFDCTVTVWPMFLWTTPFRHIPHILSPNMIWRRTEYPQHELNSARIGSHSEALIQRNRAKRPRSPCCPFTAGFRGDCSLKNLLLWSLNWASPICLF